LLLWKDDAKPEYFVFLFSLDDYSLLFGYFLYPESKVGDSFSTFCMKQKVEPKIQAIQNAPLEWPGPRTTASR
jgi:hypothetical protein